LPTGLETDLSTSHSSTVQRALITGGAGFIGSHLAQLLLEQGYQVAVIDDESTGSRSNLASLVDHPAFTYFQGSVTDPALMGKLVEDSDEIYHLAASVGVQRIVDAPIESIERNIAPVEMLLSKLLDQHRAGRPLKLFLASSSEVYGNNPKSTWTEQDNLVFGPTTCLRWSYGAAKAVDEFLALAYHRQHRLPVVIGRFFNVVGPRQTGQYGMVLPRLVERALAGKQPVVHDDGAQVRCFAHVQDVCRAVVGLMNVPSTVGEVFNIGSDQPISIGGLAQKVIEAVDPTLTIQYQPYAEAYSDNFQDVRCRVPDLTKLRQTIDFEPQFDLNAIIQEVIAWQAAGPH
jgi:UDP-glucose 4-epimerase